MNRQYIKDGNNMQFNERGKENTGNAQQFMEKVLRKDGKLIRKYLEVRVEITENSRKVFENVGKVLLKHWESMDMLAV